VLTIQFLRKEDYDNSTKWFLPKIKVKEGSHEQLVFLEEFINHLYYR
jgi:hypothetical protein